MLAKGNFNESSPYLPQRIAIFAEANHSFQDSITPDVGVQITSSYEAGKKFGFGSPIHHIMEVLRPISGSGMVGGIPTFVYPQAEPEGAAAKVITISPTGTATGNGTHTIVVNGRRQKSGGSYDINIEKGDTEAEISAKISDAINRVLGCPVTAAPSSPVGDVVCTSKWKGATADATDIEIDTNGVDLGIDYAIASTQNGSGVPSIAGALSFGNTWNTLVINGYGTDTDIMDALEAYNGRPDPVTPTGRFAGIIMKPFIALTGTTADDPSSISDARSEDCTIALCPAPKSKGFQFEAAANYCALFARMMQDSPHTDISGKYLPDMPVATEAIAMDDYDNRDAIVKKGCSTVMIQAGIYQVQDFVTTYHPEGEVPPQYRYCRNLMLDFNVRYGYYLLEIIHVKDKTIASDGDVVNVANVIKPKQWKAVVKNYMKDLGERGLIADVPFAQNSITVGISSTNPDRFETTFEYKRTGTVRIADTMAAAGFNFGTV